MILEAKRAMADWLSDATYGLAATIAALPYDGSDSAVAGTWVIADDTRGTVVSDNAAVHRIDEASTANTLYVTADDLQSADGQAATYTHDGDVPLVLTVTLRRTSPSAAVRDLDYTIRAILRVVEQLFNPTIAAAVAAVDRNDVQLQHIQSVTPLRVQEQLEDNRATANVRVVIRCRDTTA